MRRRHQAAGRLRRRLCRAERGIDRVRFGRRAEIDDHLGDRQFALRRAETFVSFPAGQRLGQRVRIGHADILGGEADQAAGDVAGVFAAGQHAREPIQRRIGIRTTQRLMQRGDQVVVLFPILVVQRGAAGEQLGHPGGSIGFVSGGSAAICSAMFRI